MLKETETEETIVFFVTFLSLFAFQLGGARPPAPPPLATPMTHSAYGPCYTRFEILSFSRQYCQSFLKKP